MRTTRPRLAITETDDVVEALDAAAARWPEISSREQLLLRLVEEGRTSLARELEQQAKRQRAAVRHTSGALTGVYAEDYLERQRDDWPA